MTGAGLCEGMNQQSEISNRLTTEEADYRVDTAIAFVWKLEGYPWMYIKASVLHWKTLASDIRYQYMQVTSRYF